MLATTRHKFQLLNFSALRKIKSQSSCKLDKVALSSEISNRSGSLSLTVGRVAQTVIKVDWVTSIFTLTRRYIRAAAAPVQLHRAPRFGVGAHSTEKGPRKVFVQGPENAQPALDTFD